MAVDKKETIKPLIEFIRTRCYTLFGLCDDWFIEENIGRYVVRPPSPRLYFDSVLQRFRTGPDRDRAYDPEWVRHLQNIYWGSEPISFKVSDRVRLIATQIIDAARVRLGDRIQKDIFPFGVSADDNGPLELAFKINTFHGKPLTEEALNKAVYYAVLKKPKGVAVTRQKGAINLLYTLTRKMSVVNEMLNTFSQVDRIEKMIDGLLLAGELDLLKIPDADRGERSRGERTLEELQKEFFEQGQRKIEMVRSYEAVYTPRRRRIDIPKEGF